MSNNKEWIKYKFIMTYKLVKIIPVNNRRLMNKLSNSILIKLNFVKLKSFKYKQIHP